MRSEYQIGTHTLHIEDDTLFVILREKFTLQDAREMTGKADLTRVGQKHVFILADLRGLKQIEPAVRKHFSDWHQVANVAGSAHFGGSMPLRIIAGLVHNAVRLVSRRIIPVIFAETEAEARAWIGARRAKLHD
jgi:hypothetical protein